MVAEAGIATVLKNTTWEDGLATGFYFNENAEWKRRH